MDYKKLEVLLRTKDVTVHNMCLEIGITPSTIYRWSYGENTPKIDKIKKIADYFGVTVDYFIS